jgi:hypothetical protein
MLPRHYRIVLNNITGQTLAIGAVKVKRTGWKYSPTGQVVYESPATEIVNNSGTVTNGQSSAGDAQDNQTDKFLGAWFDVEVTFPSSSTGRVSFRVETSANGTDWAAAFAVLDATGLATLTYRYSFSL